MLPRNLLISGALLSWHHPSNPFTSRSVALGSTKCAVPTCTAAAPASIYSATSPELSIPPSPIIGMLITLEASYTSLIVIGFMAGPDNPPVVLPRRDLRLCASIHSAGYVLAITTASAPLGSAALAVSPILLTLGESFTHSGLRASFRAA